MPDSPIYATPRVAYFAGVRSTLPITPGELSPGAICGAAMVASGQPWPVAVLASMLIYAGTMQQATIQLLATGAPWAILALTLAPSNPQFAAGLAAAAVAARWRNTLAIIIAGMLVLHAWPQPVAVLP